jgi:hypothetical protein
MKKFCNICKQDKLVSEFTHTAGRACKACRVIGNRILRNERRDELNRIKLDSGCVDCGYRKNPVALQFDHRDRSQKSFEIGHALAYSWIRLLEEVSKCDVRCANCHVIKTYEQKENQSL